MDGFFDFLDEFVSSSVATVDTDTVFATINLFLKALTVELKTLRVFATATITIVGSISNHF